MTQSCEGNRNRNRTKTQTVINPPSSLVLSVLQALHLCALLTVSWQRVGVGHTYVKTCALHNWRFSSRRCVWPTCGPRAESLDRSEWRSQRWCLCGFVSTCCSACAVDSLYIHLFYICSPPHPLTPPPSSCPPPP